MMMHETALPPPLPASAVIPGSAPPPLSKHHRYPSRSNSFSSASVVTVNQRKGSLGSSSTTLRTSGGQPSMRSQSPSDASLLALRMGREREEHPHRRRKSVAVDPAAEHEGMANINRWSQSTSSSTASLTATARRSRASSGAALATNLADHAANRTRTGLNQSPRASPQRQHISSHAPSNRYRYSPPPSPIRNPPRRDLTYPHTTLPPPQIPPTLTNPDDTDSPSTIRTIVTPSSHSNDYFGNDETFPQTSKKLGINRNHSAQGIVLTSARTDGLLKDQPLPLRSIRTSDGQGHGHVSRPSIETDTNGHKRLRTREGHDRDKKMMLSKALQKANTAVLLDNAQNLEGALDAYSDACRLLQQVMDRSSAVEDKRKLEAIRMTYTNRIHELQELDMVQPVVAESKSLPARPMSDDTLEPYRSPPMISPMNASFTASPEKIRAAGLPRMVVSRSDRVDFDTSSGATMNGSLRYLRNDIDTQQDAATSETEISPEQARLHVTAQALPLPPLETNRYMPAPLSVSPKKPSMEELKPESKREDSEPMNIEPMDSAHVRRNSTASAPWLDTIDESGSSRASSAQSMHSKSSQTGLRRKHLRKSSGDTDPDFDAAFDAAVEAAYDEGLEPDLEIRRKRQTAFAHAPRESLGLSMKEVVSHTNTGFSRMEVDEANEDERILDEITSDYAQGFNFDLSLKSALPRQSDSSGYSRSTWQSSQASMDRATTATSLSTVAEDGLSARMAEDTPSTSSSFNIVRRNPPVALPPAAPPPTSALPQLPNPNQSRISTVRSRRLSGQNAKQLMIETAVVSKPDSRQRASTFHHSPSEKHNNNESKPAFENDSRVAGATTADMSRERILKSPPSLNLRSTPSELALPTFAMEGQWRRSLDEQGDFPSARPILVRAKRSSMSLKAEHMVLMASPDVENTPFIITPMSSTFMTFASKRSQDPLNSQRAKIPAMDAGFNDGGSAVDIYLFDTSLSSPQPPSSPKLPGTVPISLEPCPESFLLRPFWLMRSLGTTLTHPRGGYVTTRLFVPREVWQTRNAKLKSVEEKIANCDLLTAALGRLAEVDTLDADAVMDELQSFEEVMERVQTSLAKKLGSDVGVHSTLGMFKDAVTGAAPATNNSHHGPETTSGAEKTKSKEHKGSYLSSWRKLRSKSSGAPLNSSAAVQRPTEKDLPTMPSVPMTSFMPVERRGHKRDMRNLIFDGPNKDYMGSLARLFDGAQVLDQIARQVEDPGLKHSSPTHVGLELSIRHAAEFFGFYVCRFVLADLTVLMDKFVKRGTEWVLA